MGCIEIPGQIFSGATFTTAPSAPTMPYNYLSLSVLDSIFYENAQRSKILMCILQTESLEVEVHTHQES